MAAKTVLLRRCLAVVGAALIGSAAPTPSRAVTLTEFAADLQSKMRGHCYSNYQERKDISYDDICGKVDGPGYDATKWWQCSQEVDKANRVIGKWNDFVRKCRAGHERGQESAARAEQERKEAERKSRPAPSGGTTATINSDVSLGYLNMRTGPGQDNGVVTRIPAGTAGVQLLGECRTPTDGKSRYRWCKVVWQGHTGWVSSGSFTSDGVEDPTSTAEPPRETRVTDEAPSSRCVCIPGGLNYCLDRTIPGHDCIRKMVDGKEFSACGQSKFDSISREDGFQSCQY